MALTLITVRDTVTLVSLADPDVRLRPGLRVSEQYVYQSMAVVEEDDAIVGPGATRIIARGIRDTELAAVSGQGEHVLFIGAAKRGTKKIRKGDFDSLPYGVKYSVGQWVVGDSTGHPLRCVAVDDEQDDNPLPPSPEDASGEESAPVDPLARS